MNHRRFTWFLTGFGAALLIGALSGPDRGNYAHPSAQPYRVAATVGVPG